MSVAYLDTSAAMKLLVAEAESAALLREINEVPGRQLVSSWLLHAELHCAAGRQSAAISRASVGIVLDAVVLVDVARGDLLAAGTLEPLRAADAIHLAVALRVGAGEMLSYDRELGSRAQAAGLRVISPV